MTTVSVVMATYNRRQLLPRVLAPLLDDPATFELVIVVDGCEDGSIEYLEALAAEDPRVRPIFVPNGGRVAAQETGVEAARGDVVVLVMDDDVLAAPGLVSGHARHHERERDLVVVGYMPTERPACAGPVRSRPSSTTTSTSTAARAGRAARRRSCAGCGAATSRCDARRCWPWGASAAASR